MKSANTELQQLYGVMKGKSDLLAVLAARLANSSAADRNGLIDEIDHTRKEWNEAVGNYIVGVRNNLGVE